MSLHVHENPTVNRDMGYLPTQIKGLGSYVEFCDQDRKSQNLVT